MHKNPEPHKRVTHVVATTALPFKVSDRRARVNRAMGLELVQAHGLTHYFFTIKGSYIIT